MTGDLNLYYYTYLSDGGPVTLSPEANGKFKILVNHENLGSYASLQDAFIAAVSGKTLNEWSGGDLVELDLPGEIEKWQRKQFALVKRLRSN